MNNLNYRYSPGQRLLDQLEEFYISYGSWRSEYPENFYCFSLLKRITEISIRNGGYLSDKEEKELMERFEGIKEGLYSGNLKHNQIPYAMHQLILTLVAKNSKAKLIAHTVELEYFLQEKNGSGFDLIQRMIAKVTPDLSEISAYAAAKEMALLLAKISKNPHQKADILHTLETTLKKL